MNDPISLRQPASASPPAHHEDLWTAEQVSKFLKCSVSYVYKAAERDILPAVRIGRMLRFRPEAVRNFITNTTTG
jgi:excisionase family DNA binding protein